MRFFLSGLCLLAVLASSSAWADRSYTEEEIRECRDAEANGKVVDSFCQRLLRQEGSGDQGATGSDEDRPRSEYDENDPHDSDCVETEDGCVVDGSDDAYDSGRAERLDERGDRREDRLDERADRAADHGNEDRSERLENRGDEANERLDEQADRTEERKDNRDQRQESRQSRRSAGGRN